MEEVFKYGIVKTEHCTTNVRKFSHSIASGCPTKKQLDYHTALIKHLKKNGIDTKLFDRPRNNPDCRSKINAMITVCKKNGIWESFPHLNGGKNERRT